MNLREMFIEMTKPWHNDAYEKVEIWESKAKQYKEDAEFAKKEIEPISKQLTECKTELLDLKNTPVIEPISPLNVFLDGRYTLTPNIAYKGKRLSARAYYSVYLNQMITPRAFEVLSFRKKFDKYVDTYLFMSNIGEFLARSTTWVDETKLYPNRDYYYYPEEVLTGMKNKIDCEDLSFTMASFRPHICGVAYGFFHKNGAKYGHAWPVFIYDAQLFIVETTGNSAQIVHEDDSRYEPYFIITQTKTYQVKEGLEFGDIARFDD